MNVFVMVVVELSVDVVAAVVVLPVPLEIDMLEVLRQDDKDDEQ